MAKHRHILFLNGNNASVSWLAVGMISEVIVELEKGGFSTVEKFLDDNQDQYVFGYFSYDLKNDLELLESKHTNHTNLPVAHFFVPVHLAQVSGKDLKVIKGSESVLQQTYSELNQQIDSPTLFAGEINFTLTRQQYLDKILQVKNHIQQGDIYEANFCYEVFAENVDIQPSGVYQKLNKQTEAPFSVYGQLYDNHILSASPERFIKRVGDKVTSQPIKGTIKRGASTEEDNELIAFLEHNPKDRSENVMIVDLVRNDLSKIANPKSVEVEELCKIYTFKNIHQMISTVNARVEGVKSIEVIKALFPMGSMTGAPKIRAMQLMEELEESKRGLYSGCIGYFAPNGDFDFNVVIRTIIYNETEKKLSFSVGGAITDLSLPELEYEETLLKAEALIQALTR